MSKKTLKQIRQSDNHYVVQLKDNCSTLVAQAQLIKANLPRDSFFSRETNRGRLEMRWVRVYDWSGSPPAWAEAEFATLIVVDRFTLRSQEFSHKQHFYLSDLSHPSALDFAHLIRGHWAIENSLHWVKDVILDEDRATLSEANAAENLSTFKDFAINIFRNHGFNSLKYALIFFANKLPKLCHLFLSA